MKGKASCFGKIGHLGVIQRGKDEVQDLLEGRCIPSRLVYLMGVGPSKLKFGSLDHPVRTLFDSGTSHSFVSSSLVESLHLDTSLVDDPLVVSNPIGGSTYLSMICLGLKISILSIEFRCDAFVLGFTGYGLILGMDWLSSNGVVLDCERRVVRLMTRLGNTLEISCNPMDSVMLSYLESLDASVESLRSVGVVREYSDVFEEVKGLPPRREIDFRIYLVDNAKPVSLPVRHMAPRERRELHKQVGELLEKGFIRRSISEWGAPVVFATKADGSLRLCVG